MFFSLMLKHYSIIWWTVWNKLNLTVKYHQRYSFLILNFFEKKAYRKTNILQGTYKCQCCKMLFLTEIVDFQENFKVLSSQIQNKTRHRRDSRQHTATIFISVSVERVRIFSWLILYNLFLNKNEGEFIPRSWEEQFTNK